MNVIGLDLGGTKLAAAIFDSNGKILHKELAALETRRGAEVGSLITQQMQKLISHANSNSMPITAIGMSVPGIYFAQSGTVWAPNIPEWTDYPLLSELCSLPEAKHLDIKIDSDRACYILGETWQGSAKGCNNAIFLAIGTGIGAGILIDGVILRGHHDIAGAIGWMGLSRPFRNEYGSCGCFEYHASGEGIARIARELLAGDSNYSGKLSKKDLRQITSHDIFEAYESHDPIAIKVLEDCIAYWGMAVANLVSIFNPEKIIFGGGVFGPAARFLDQIKAEAQRWAQPISMKQVSLEVSTLGGDAGIIGAGRLALMALDENL
ncbi:MAG TPA: ROK family protein [bacterium]